MKKAIIYVHGKGGNATEALFYKDLCPDYDIFGVDYSENLPWIVREQIKTKYDDLVNQYDEISLITNSIGTYFAMLALQECKIQKAYFISPILNMERLLTDMMSWAGVSEAELEARKEIPTDFGETLSWDYLCYVRSNPIHWTVPTAILYAGKDNLTSSATVNEFVSSHNASLTVMEDGAHWFHTKEQLDFLGKWITAELQNQRSMMIETERLILRKWSESDAESLFEYAKDPAVGPIAGWPPHKSVEESLSVIQNVFCGKECYAICLKDSKKPIGSIELLLKGHTNVPVGENECELGYWIGKPFWGNGYGPEAAKELIHHAFEDLGMTTIWCGYYDGNTQSKRVQEKCGFQFHSTQYDVPVPLMNEVRTLHLNILKRESYYSVKKNVRILLLVIGCISFVLGTLGIILPVLPTIPFYLVTTYCFMRTVISPKLRSKE